MNAEYAYVYDDFLTDRDCEREVAALETTLSTYNVAGKICRLAMFRSAKELVASVVNQGARTIVVVGNDATLDKVMWFLPDLNVTVGFIPLAGPSFVAGVLGIPVGVSAADTLSARYVETLDVGKIDDRYFLTEVSLPETVAGIEVDGQFRIAPAIGGSLSVRNLGGVVGGQFERSDARDGLLEIVVRAKQDQPRKRFWQRDDLPVPETRIFARNGRIESPDPVQVMVDRHAMNGFHFDVQVVPQALKIITGRGGHRPAGDRHLRVPRKIGTFRVANAEKGRQG